MSNKTEIRYSKSGKPYRAVIRDPRFFVCGAALTSAGYQGRTCTKRVEKPGMKCARHARQSALAPQTDLEADLTKLLKKVGAPGQPHRDPREVLLDTVTRAHQMVAVLDSLIQGFTKEDMELLGYEGDIEVVAVGRVATAIPTSRALQASHIKAVLDLHGKWVAEAARISKATVSAGIEDRLVRLAEQQSRVVADVIRATIESLPISAEQRAWAMAEAARRLRGIGAEEPKLIMEGRSQEVEVA